MFGIVPSLSKSILFTFSRQNWAKNCVCKEKLFKLGEKTRKNYGKEKKVDIHFSNSVLFLTHGEKKKVDIEKWEKKKSRYRSKISTFFFFPLFWWISTFFSFPSTHQTHHNSFTQNLHKFNNIRFPGINWLKIYNGWKHQRAKNPPSKTKNLLKGIFCIFTHSE